MAYTITKYRSDFGNKVAIGLDVTADAATQTVDLGLTQIEWISGSYSSMTTITGKTIAINSNASGVQSMGVLGLSGFTNGDRFFITVYGH